MKSSQISPLVLVVKPKELPELKNHKDEVLPPPYGPRVFHLGDELVPGADMFITSRTITSLDGPAEPNVQPHRHAVSQTYLVFGSGDDGLEVEVAIEEQKVTARAPTTIFIPAGAMHSIRVLRGTGTLVGVLRSGRYD